MKEKDKEFDLCFFKKITIKATIIKAIRNKEAPYLIKKRLLAQPDFQQQTRGFCQEKISKSLDNIIWEIWNQEQESFEASKY